MSAVLAAMDWAEKTKSLEVLLKQEGSFVVSPMKQGFEAEVVKLHSDTHGSYILKIWNKHSRPDVSFQYRLLSTLFERGISVSRPLGWGVMPGGAQALLTAYDGISVNPLHPEKMTAIAGILGELHLLNPHDIEGLNLPCYDFVAYHFQGLDAHHDIAAAIQSILPTVEMKQDRIVHGDFHPENIVVDGERYTVIDWTNGQLGDPRYDFAWSYFLLRLYLSEQHAYHFRTAYAKAAHDVPQQELERYEALGILRWMLLNRNGHVLARPEVVQHLNRLVESHVVLKEFELRKNGV
ncbi:aminoglycoside phosphotransferase family protein [Paenibacillus pinisoli]|uniref:Aminoglycoside phosphotransferase family protein n=1 Tax=Paenibacillus pinisoli TaxID=1276110 RepID=A0A3A6PDT9_9BACL|nr:aminoglycoside phosphotransferase family protein [Paenibacillus pinisoli]RJX38947.1 aminoglycoside phosphotransferase family protein [Paenibacillus pinisoli]